MLIFLKKQNKKYCSFTIDKNIILCKIKNEQEKLEN